MDPAGPDRVGLVGRQPHESVLWRLADADIEPRYSAMDGAEGGGDDVWGSTPEQRELLDPGAGGKLPPERAHRKRLQIEALVRLVRAVLPVAAPPAAAGDAERPHVVDFCGGSGHTALVIAAAMPAALVTIVDFNSTALRLAAERAAQLGLANVRTHCGDVAAFSGAFSVGLALHACGAATDMALARCRESGAAFVVSPCCVGKIGKTTAPRPREGTADAAEPQPPAPLPLPRSRLFARLLSKDDYLALAAAADFHSVEHPMPRRRAAKAMIELDRAAAMHEGGYCVRLGKLPPEARSPKDDVLWGWPSTFVACAQLQQCWAASIPAREMAFCGYSLHRASTGAGAPDGKGDEQAHRARSLELLTPDATAEEREGLLQRLRPLLPGQGAAEVEVKVVSTLPKADGGGGKGGGNTADSRKRRKAERRAARLAAQRPKAASADTGPQQPFGAAAEAGVTVRAAPQPAAAPPQHFQGRNERRLLHELCHGMLLRHWTADSPIRGAGSCVLASAAPCWPYVWDDGIHAVGAAVEEAVAPHLPQLPAKARWAWEVRCETSAKRGSIWSMSDRRGVFQDGARGAPRAAAERGGVRGLARERRGCSGGGAAQAAERRAGQPGGCGRRPLPADGHGPAGYRPQVPPPGCGGRGGSALRQA